MISFSTFFIAQRGTCSVGWFGLVWGILYFSVVGTHYCEDGNRSVKCLISTNR